MKKSIKKGVIFSCLSVISCLTVAAGAKNAFSKESLLEPTAIYTEFGETVSVAILKQGSTGGEVKEVQRRLKKWGYYNGSVDGVFGAGTRAAVIAFQKKNGLTADGVVGKATYKALGMTGSYNSLSGQSGQSGQTKVWQKSWQPSWKSSSVMPSHGSMYSHNSFAMNWHSLCESQS